jgi:putative transposase
VESGMHLAACVLYIDMNMVRAGAVDRPSEWDHSGFHEIRGGIPRVPLINRKRLSTLLGLTSESELCDAHIAWHASSIVHSVRQRNEVLSSAFAVGSRSFVQEFQRRLGARGLRCETLIGDDYSALHGRCHKPVGPV